MSTPSPQDQDRLELEGLAFSDKYPKLRELLREMQGNFWMPEDVSAEMTNEDKRRFGALEKGVKRALTIVLYWFAFADQLVGDSCGELGVGMKDTCIQAAYAFIEAMEKSVHAPVYAALLRFYVDPEGEGKGAKEAMQELVRPKIEAVQELLEGASPARRLFVQAAVESILFQLSFRFIVVVHRAGGPHALADANNLIARDEGDHVKWAAAVSQELGLRVSKEEGWAIVERLVGEEKAFIKALLGPEGVIGFHGRDLEKYAEFIGDYVLRLFGIEERWGVENPYPDQVSTAVRRLGDQFSRSPTTYTIHPPEEVADDAFEAE